MNTTPAQSRERQLACLRYAIELGREKQAAATASQQPGDTIPVPSSERKAA
jgi:hypothetical protein